MSKIPLKWYKKLIRLFKIANYKEALKFLNRVEQAFSKNERNVALAAVYSKIGKIH